MRRAIKRNVIIKNTYVNKRCWEILYTNVQNIDHRVKTYTYMYMYTHMYSQMYVRMNEYKCWADISTHTYIYIYMCVCVSVCMLVFPTACQPVDQSWQHNHFHASWQLCWHLALILSFFHFYFSSQFLGEWQSCAVLGNRHRKYWAREVIYTQFYIQFVIVQKPNQVKQYLH